VKNTPADYKTETFDVSIFVKDARYQWTGHTKAMYATLPVHFDIQ
jgi:hypothetical protein